jgi:GntR family transcriptional regulator, transcriptional repressor for pyruvate dehydrogenase complex
MTAPARLRGATEHVAAEIQHHIQREALGPGDFLGREDDLAAAFGVSRPTLREALKLLSSGNLIRATRGPGGGIFVARTADRGMSRSVSDAIAMMLETGAVSLEELLEARLLLEVPLAGLAARRSDEATVKRLREALRAARRSPDDAALAAIDADIHRTIAAAAAGNRVIRALTDWTFEVAQPSTVRATRPEVVRSAVIDQHEALLAAIAEGDASSAERAMRDHLLYLRSVLETAREEPVRATPRGAPSPRARSA